MAIISHIDTIRLRVNLDGGLEGDKQIVKSMTYSRIDNAATDENIYKVGYELAALVADPLLAIIKGTDTVLDDTEA